MGKKWDDMEIEERQKYMDDYIMSFVDEITYNIYQDSSENNDPEALADLKFINVVVCLFLRVIQDSSKEELGKLVIKDFVKIVNKNIPNAINEDALLSYIDMIKGTSSNESIN